LKDEGVDTDLFLVHKGGMGTAYSLILVTSSGERTILTYKGEGQNFNENEIDWDEVEASWFYVDSLGGNLELLKKIIEVAKEKDIKIAMNPGGRTLAHGLDALKPYLKDINIFATNQEEAARLTGVDHKNEKEIFKLMDELIDGVCIMTKGPEGAVVSDGKKIYRVSASAGEAVERTGAGDSFNSGFLAGYIHSDGNIRESLKSAMANAESVVSYIGATKGILKKGDLGLVSIPEVTEEGL
jgi:sugar/nucleoside kinase (ribokinase family)